MYSSIYFCTDGILRAKNHDKPLIPLTFIQEYSQKKDDFSFWVDWWNGSVQFEKGLTLSGFFNCLEPWSEFLSTLTNVEIQTYIDEMRKPCSVEKQSKFAYMEISSEHLFIPELKHLEEIEWTDLNDLKTKAKEKRLMQLTGLWDSTRRTSTNGYMADDKKDQRYGFHLSHPECYANVPLVLNEIVHTSFFNYNLNRYFGEETPILNDLPYIITKKDETVTIASKKYFTFRELIESFFRELRKTPQDFRNLDKLLEERMKAYMERDKARAIEKEVEKAESNKVVSIHKNKDSYQSSENNSNNQEKKVSFEMTPGFLSDLASLGAKDSELWNFLVNEAVKKDVVLRIGKIEEQEVPETRVFGHIVSPETYIQKSEPKLL